MSDDNAAPDPSIKFAEKLREAVEEFWSDDSVVGMALVVVLDGQAGRQGNILTDLSEDDLLQALNNHRHDVMLRRKQRAEGDKLN